MSIKSKAKKLDKVAGDQKRSYAANKKAAKTSAGHKPAGYTAPGTGMSCNTGGPKRMGMGK